MTAHARPTLVKVGSSPCKLVHVGFQESPRDSKVAGDVEIKMTILIYKTTVTCLRPSSSESIIRTSWVVQNDLDDIAISPIGCAREFSKACSCIITYIQIPSRRIAIEVELEGES